MWFLFVLGIGVASLVLSRSRRPNRSSKFSGPPQTGPASDAGSSIDFLDFGTSSQKGHRWSEAEKALFARTRFAEAKFLGCPSKAAAENLVSGGSMTLPDGVIITADSFEAIRCTFPGCSRMGVHGVSARRIANPHHFRKTILFEDREGKTIAVSDTCAKKYLDPIAHTLLTNYAEYAVHRRLPMRPTSQHFADRPATLPVTQ